MIRTLLWLFLTLACKQLPGTKPATKPATTPEVQQLLDEYLNYTQRANEVLFVDQMRDLHEKIKSVKPQASDLKKINHHLRSILSVTRAMKCRVDKEGYYLLRADDLCVIIVRQLLKMRYQDIDLDNTNEKFFADVSTGKYDRFFHAGEYREIKFDRAWYQRASGGEIREFFQALLTEILALTVSSMQKYQQMFPFVLTADGWQRTCRGGPAGRGNPDSGNAASPPRKTKCAQLADLPTTSTPTTVYKDVTAAASALNAYVSRLNALRQELNELYTQPTERFAPQATKQQKFLFLPGIHITNPGNQDVTRRHEEHEIAIAESAQQALFPLLLSHFKGGLHLEKKGRFFGLAKVRHSLLSNINDQHVAQQLRKLRQQLVASWWQTKAIITTSQGWSNDESLQNARQVYMWAIHHELATARVLLQKPQYSVVVGYLLADHQQAINAPKWLQLAKKATYRIDIGLIPICILGGIFFPPAAPALAILATAANFLWVGSATADALVAHNRFAKAERAILSGTSQQTADGLRALRKSREKVGQAIVSGTLGTVLSALSIGKIVKGVDKGFKFFAIDMGGAFGAEIFTGQDLTLLGKYEGPSDSSEMIMKERQFAPRQ